MKRVAASPQSLVSLSRHLANHVEAYQRIGSRLRAECDLAHPLASELDESARIADRLARAMAEITAFVAATARDLDAADRTLTGVVNRSGRRGGQIVLASGGRSTTLYKRRTQRSRRYGSFVGAEPIGTGVAASATAGNVRSQFHGVTFASRDTTIALGQGAEFTWGSPNANLSASYFVGGSATGEVSAGYREGMATASVGGRTQLGLSTAVGGSIGTDRFGARGSVDAFVGVMAEAKADIGIGLNGVSAEAGVRAFVGGEVTATGQLTLAAVTARGEAGVLYGAGFEVHGDVDLSLNEIGASLDIGAALGFGGHLAFDVTVSPKKLAVDFVTGDLAVDAMQSGFNAAGNVVGGGINAAGNVVGGGFKKLFG